MTREITSLFTFNRGVVSHLGLARIDVKRLSLAAEDQTNWMPRVLGSMSLRPGLQYVMSTLGNAAARYLRFIFGTSDTSLLEFTANTMRVLINEVALTRPAVATVIANPTFATGPLTGWTGLDEGSAVSSYVAPNLQLVGAGTARAIREQHVTCASPNIEHGIRIIIPRGPVTIRIGSTSGDDDYFSESTLNTGTHSLSIVPTGDFYIRFFSRKTQIVQVASCTIEAAGVVTLPTPWGVNDLSALRYDQSADVIFIACAGYQQRRVERRGTRPSARSWSIVLYLSPDGPFQIQNTGQTTIASNAINGNVTLTSSVPMFKSSHVGALFALTSTGQQVTAVGSADGDATGSIRVTGLHAGTANARNFQVKISGDATLSTVVLQRSYDSYTWVDVNGTGIDSPYVSSWTADVNTTIVEVLDNQIVYYRLLLKTRIAPDVITLTLTFANGNIRGIARVTDFTDNQHVKAEVIRDLGGLTATKFWEEGQWSDKNGWPTACKIHEGRMWMAGKNGIIGSISDAYDSFDPTVVGDSGAINRTVGSGPVDTINWVLSLKGLLLGAEGAEYTVRASSLDEPLTPTNFNLKTSTTQGSAVTDAIKVDQAGYFVNRSGTKVFGIEFDLRAYDYFSTPTMELCPEIGYPGIVRIDVQRLPDTRLHCVRSDGTVVVAVLAKAEDVLAWVPVTTNGFVEDVVVLPANKGDLDDRVYYVVRRTVNGATVRYLERMAQEINCRGDKPLCQLADAHITYSGAPTNVISGLSHLEGLQVAVWADGKDVGTDDTHVPWTQRYTVSGGQIALAVAASNVVVGLPYSATYKSVKLGSATQGVSPLNEQKKAGHIGLVLANTHPRGLKFGPDFTYLDDMPLIEDGTTVGTAPWTDYDQNLLEFPGTWTTDLRICLLAQAPRPVTVTGVTMDLVSFT